MKRTGNYYMDAYIARRENNHGVFLKLAEKLKYLGCRVYASPHDNLLTYIRVEKDNKFCYVGFGEVPYRWYVDNSTAGNDIDSRGLVGEHGYDFPFTIEEIMSKLRPITKGKERKSFYMEL